ncbi:MAG: hypothetical protein AB2556_24240 [Candidatus Thiodiazotropha sp.]
MAVQATFQSMGLRSTKAVASHFLLENGHDSNLLSDIAQVDYLARGWGPHAPAPPTHLGLLTFINNVYVYGYLHRDDFLVHRGRLSCTTGDGRHREKHHRMDIYRGA